MRVRVWSSARVRNRAALQLDGIDVGGATGGRTIAAHGAVRYHLRFIAARDWSKGMRRRGPGVRFAKKTGSVETSCRNDTQQSRGRSSIHPESIWGLTYCYHLVVSVRAVLHEVLRLLGFRCAAAWRPPGSVNAEDMVRYFIVTS